MYSFILTQITFGNMKVSSNFLFQFLYFLLFQSSALDDNREINHHGHSVSVGDKDRKVDSAIVSFDKDLISRNEKVQDAALKYCKTCFIQH